MQQSYYVFDNYQWELAGNVYAVACTPHTCRDMLWMYVVEVRRVDSLWPGLYSAAAFAPLLPVIFQRHFYNTHTYTTIHLHSHI